jgi:signal transduction histidine kinase
MAKQPIPTDSPSARENEHTRAEVLPYNERLRELVALQIELSRLGLSADLDGILARVVQSACELLAGEGSILSLVDETNHGWVTRKTWTRSTGWTDQAYPKQENGMVQACMQLGQPLYVVNLQEDARFAAGSDGIEGLDASTGFFAPLMNDGVSIGVLEVLCSAAEKNTERAFERDLLTMAAGLAAAAIQGARLVRELKVSNADLEANRWELLSSRNMLRALFDNLPAGLYIIDRQYRLAAINSGRADRAGSAPQRLVGQFCYASLFQRSEPCADCRVMHTFEDGIVTHRREHRWENEKRNRSDNGRKRERSETEVRIQNDSSEWEIHSYPIPSESGLIGQAILFEQDVTDKYRLESVLAQSEKLAVIGQLAAGVAHEINNPLTAIIANAQILHRELPPNHDLQESVDLIARAGARAAQVVRNLLDYARKEEYRLGMTDINETLERALELVRHELVARGIRVEFTPGAGLPPILASQDHLQSVWLNLLLNAVDSLDKSPAEIRMYSQRLGDEIHVIVKDNGKGIPPENLARIFEPFYTTKAPGKGTGLGLSVSYRIVQQHGGQIRVESRPGAGSVFTVILPLV